MVRKLMSVVRDRRLCVEQKSATTYKKGKNCAKTTTQKIHKE
jgi:hypothetical protein